MKKIIKQFMATATLASAMIACNDGHYHYAGEARMRFDNDKTDTMTMYSMNKHATDTLVLVKDPFDIANGAYDVSIEANMEDIHVNGHDKTGHVVHDFYDADFGDVRRLRQHAGNQASKTVHLKFVH